jgi:hypothetical protein
LANDAALDHFEHCSVCPPLHGWRSITQPAGTRRVTAKQNSLLASVCLT